MLAILNFKKTQNNNKNAIHFNLGISWELLHNLKKQKNFLSEHDHIHTQLINEQWTIT